MRGVEQVRIGGGFQGGDRPRHVALVPAQAYVAQHLATYQEFPPRQKPGSFSLDEVLAKLQEAGAGNK